MFDTNTRPKRENRLVELAKQDLANAQDNLYRARAAARGCDATIQWGRSGQTLNEIIAGYEKWESEAQTALEEARRLTGGPKE